MKDIYPYDSCFHQESSRSTSVSCCLYQQADSKAKDTALRGIAVYRAKCVRFELHTALCPDAELGWKLKRGQWVTCRADTRDVTLVGTTKSLSCAGPKCHQITAVIAPLVSVSARSSRAGPRISFGLETGAAIVLVQLSQNAYLDQHYLSDKLF